MIDHKVHLPVKQFFSIIFYIHLIAVKTKFKIQSFGYIDFYEIVDEKKKMKIQLIYWITGVSMSNLKNPIVFHYIQYKCINRYYDINKDKIKQHLSSNKSINFT